MPSNRDEYEMAFLGSVLLDSDILASSYLTEAMFGRHRRVYTALVELSSKAKINADDTPMLLRAGLDGQTVAAIITATPSSANWEFYQKGIFDAWAEEQFKNACKMAVGEPYPACLDTVERALTSVALRQTGAKTRALRDVVVEAMGQITERMKARGKIPGLTWGFETIDACTLGAQIGHLVVIGARPSQGKSALAAQLALNQARAGVKVGFVTVESSERSLVTRMLASDSKIDGRKLQTGMVGEAAIADLALSAKRLVLDSIVIHDQPSIRLTQLQAVVRKMVRDGCGVVYVDYLQLIRVPGKDKRSEEVGEASTSLKALARELKIPIVAMAQLGRDSDERRPSIGDFQHSSQIEQDADQCWLIWHKQDDDGNFTDSRIILAKVRDGSVRDIKVRFDRPTLTFYEVVSDRS